MAAQYARHDFEWVGSDARIVEKKKTKKNKERLTNFMYQTYHWFPNIFVAVVL